MNIVQQVKELFPRTCIPNVYTKEIPISEVAEGLSIKDEAQATWEASLEAGKAAMGRENLLTAQLDPYQKAAYEWAIQNPGWILALSIKVPHEDFWEEILMVGKHGEYVVFYTENTSGGAIWISRDNETRVLVYRD